MDWITIVLTLLLCVATGMYFNKWRLKRRKFIDALNRIPGPPTWPIIGNIENIGVPPEGVIKLTMDLIKKYGKFFRLWSAEVGGVMVSNVEYIETILSGTEEIDKSLPYKFLEPWLGKGLLTGTGSKWHLHRKMITPSFHFKILESFIETFDEKSQILVNKLNEITPGTEFNIYPMITLCTLDIICETAMGIKMNSQVQSQESQKNAEYISGIHEVSDSTMARLIRPWLYSDWIFYNLSSYGKTYTKSLDSLHSFTRQVVAEKKAARVNNKDENSKNTKKEDDFGVKKKQAFLDLLLEAAGGEEISDKEIREQVDTLMFGGHDTTTASISWCLFLLGNHPEIQDKLFEELNNIFQGEKRKITTADLREMKYMEMVIKESLRIYPSVPVIGRLLKNDMQLGEYIVPSGAYLRVSIYAVHHDPDNYENPEVFNPDNFLPEKVKNRNPFAFIPFSAGPRNCIGQKFALFEEKTILASILLNFRVESTKKVEDVTPVPDLILRPKNGIPVKIYPRTTK